MSSKDFVEGRSGAAKSLNREYVCAPRELKRIGTCFAWATLFASKYSCTRSRYDLMKSESG